MASINQVLLKYLDELEQEDFDRFKSSLRNDLPQGFDPIPRGKLENAKQLKVVELMVDQYVDLDAAHITVHVLKKIKKNKLATELENELGGKMSGVSEAPAMAKVPKQITGAEFVDKHRGQLIQRVSSVMEIADCLLSMKILTSEKYSNVRAEHTPQAKMRILYDSLTANRAKEEFYNILKEKETFLVEELES